MGIGPVQATTSSHGPSIHAAMFGTEREAQKFGDPVAPEVPPAFPVARWSRPALGATTGDLSGMQATFQRLTVIDQACEVVITAELGDGTLANYLAAWRASGTYGLLPRPSSIPASAATTPGAYGYGAYGAGKYGGMP